MHFLIQEVKDKKYFITKYTMSLGRFGGKRRWCSILEWESITHYNGRQDNK